MNYNYRPTMIGTEPTLGIGASKEVELFVLLSPVGTYYSRYNEIINLCKSRDSQHLISSWSNIKENLQIVFNSKVALSP